MLLSVPVPSPYEYELPGTPSTGMWSYGDRVVGEEIYNEYDEQKYTIFTKRHFKLSLLPAVLVLHSAYRCKYTPDCLAPHDTVSCASLRKVGVINRGNWLYSPIFSHDRSAFGNRSALSRFSKRGTFQSSSILPLTEELLYALAQQSLA